MLDIAQLTYLEEETLERVLLQEVVHRLPTKEKVVVVLRLAGYTQQECSEIVGGTRASIGIIHKRALTKLRGWLTRDDAE